jgi:aspartate aminotransferase-like enzyme
MNDISRIVKSAYHARSTVIVPGSGTFAMEAVARQFATAQKCLILRNGWFSYRWTQILDMAQITRDALVLKAARIGSGPQAPFAPASIAHVLETIKSQRPAVVFAPHVETASGIILPDDYIRRVGAAVREAGGLFVLDCIASGTVWVNLVECEVDVLISAPQKGWSGPPCCGLVALGERARARIDETKSSSFSCDLLKWLQIMESYEKGGFAYHATMPTDSLVAVRDAMQDTERFGFGRAAEQAKLLGTEVRDLLRQRGFPSVAADGFGAPGVIVSYTTRPEIQSGKAFRDLGMQIAAGVPLQCDEGDDFRSFRIGLFGLDKLGDRARTVGLLKRLLDEPALAQGGELPP